MEKALVTSTVKTKTASGKIYGVSRRAAPLMAYRVTLVPMSQTQSIYVDGFLTYVKVNAKTFRFRDWDFFQATVQAIANPYPSTTAQLTYTYTVTGGSVVKNILLPVSGTVTIFENGSALTSGTHYTLDYTTGIVTFLASKPVNGAVYTWTGQFDIPVAFPEDKLFYMVNPGLVKTGMTFELEETSA